MSCSRFVPDSPVSSHGLTFVLSIASSFLSYLFPWTSYDSGFGCFSFYSGVADFTSSFVSTYFISFILLVVLWYSFFVPFYFIYTVLSEYGSDNSSELVSHQMAYPSFCRTRFPS